MVYRFKFVSDEVPNFSRTIEIDSEASFLDLRNAVLESVAYNKDVEGSFFICDEQWEKLDEISLEDMGSMSDQDVYLMEETPLIDMIEDEGTKLIFDLDYNSDRCFFMELKETIPSRTLHEPICTMKAGTPPPQFPKVEEEVALPVVKTNIDTDFNDDLFNEEGYDDEDIPEGFLDDDSINFND